MDDARWAALLKLTTQTTSPNIINNYWFQNVVQNHRSLYVTKHVARHDVEHVNVFGGNDGPALHNAHDTAVPHENL
jgi:hypothetical protein